MRFVFVFLTWTEKTFSRIPQSFSSNFHALIIIGAQTDHNREAGSRFANWFCSQLGQGINKHRCEASEPFCSPLSKINDGLSARWGTRRIGGRGKTFESLLRRMKFCGGGRFLLAWRGRARISPFSQITGQMLTQFRRRIGRYSVFRKCWLEYAMSEKFEVAAFLSSTRAETLEDRWTGSEIRREISARGCSPDFYIYERHASLRAGAQQGGIAIAYKFIWTSKLWM